MAAAKRKAAPAARPVVSAATRERVAVLRAKAASERHGGTALELRVAALESLVAELVK